MQLPLILTTFFVALAVASPGTTSLKRSFIERDGIQIACIECPCDGFSGVCYCVEDGCCVPHCKGDQG
ncbi:hypothetical protein P153DRAFT_380967 [Dothidotthia symphoricarpi CBS 119687]|uniref:Uncharacterized protein n=1 Tax=Dothidotthia symphoricarpi CBS 119687 TaxID=1392245 RepID=A0A6A6APE1_9PLEO|nr:uncharacterized protein P153DRAFT_380967 [Dothidotthia symphoricarpi CBS 119687]KAF2133789.1 hypothetical protein P153DRAFT_380967 [Dothidotthia symphoricarpi CBS 119687]